MAQLSDLTVTGFTKINADTTVYGDAESSTIDNGRVFNVASSEVVPSINGKGIVTENYLYWALRQ